MNDLLCGLAMLLGLALVAVGVWQVYEPAALIVVGLALFIAGWRLVGGST
jgi:hypothetical protein